MKAKALIRLSRCAGWSASLLFAYGINRFSHDVAHSICNLAFGCPVSLKYSKIETDMVRYCQDLSCILRVSPISLHTFTGKLWCFCIHVPEPHRCITWTTRKIPAISMSWVMSNGHTIMILSFWTGKSGQTLQTQIRLLQEEQSDLGLHCLQFRLHLLNALLYGKSIFFKF